MVSTLFRYGKNWSAPPTRHSVLDRESAFTFMSFQHHIHHSSLRWNPGEAGPANIHFRPRHHFLDSLEPMYYYTIMRKILLNKRMRVSRSVSSPFLRESRCLDCRNESTLKKFACCILDTVVAKTIDFAGTNRACGDKMMLPVTKRIEAESTR
jgi:hypothetical protein